MDYSEKVDLKLIVHFDDWHKQNKVYELSHTGIDTVVIRDQCKKCGPTKATIEITVDGVKESHRVYLHKGIEGEGPWQEVPFLKLHDQEKF